MSYLIRGPDGIELRFSAGTFHELYQHGYDWFGLIDAAEMDGYYSGIGAAKRISVRDLRRALDELERVAPGERRWTLPDPLPPHLVEEKRILEMMMIGMARTIESTREIVNMKLYEKLPDRDPFVLTKPPLVEFMTACITWCHEQHETAVQLVFA